MPRFAAQNPLLLDLVCPALEGGRVTVSRLGAEFQVARFDAAGRLLFVANRSRYQEARRLARTMTVGANDGGAETAHL